MTELKISLDPKKVEEPQNDSDSESSSDSSEQTSNQEQQLKMEEEKEKLKLETLSTAVINKWLSLQKIIKQEITLEEVIVNRHKSDFLNLKTFFKDYHNTKLKLRNNIEDIKKLSKNKLSNFKELIIDRCDVGQVLVDTYEPIKNLLFLFRNNYDYITRLSLLIDEKDEIEKVDSLVQLFCNQFYDNILIPNPEQIELLILIYKLLENEIKKMNCASLNNFLSNNKFLGKFISAYVSRPEFNMYLSMLMNPIITSIENSDEDYLDMSLKDIQNYVVQRANNRNLRRSSFTADDICDKNYDIFSKLSIKIPKSNIIFKKNYELEIEKEEEETKVKKEEDLEIFASDTDLLNFKDLQINKNNEKMEPVEEFNDEYKEYLTLDKLNNLFNDTKDHNLKDFYSYQLEKFVDNQEIFSIKNLVNYLDNNYKGDMKNNIVKKYKKNFLYIQKKISALIQSMIDKISTIPYTVRCISKIIYLLISKKFPNLPNILLNSFIGKFFFNKYIFPVLSLENKNIMSNRIFSLSTKRCLNVMISVLTNLYECCLFNTNNDMEKTIFNYYLIELTPIINTFYEKLIDIELPKAVEKLVEESDLNVNSNIIDKMINLTDDNKPVDTNLKTNEENILYDYFSENKDEIIRIQSICFSLNDILFILSLIGKKIEIFEGLPKYNFFCKTYKHIKSKDYKIDAEIDKDPKKTKFYILFKDDKINQLENLVNKKVNDDFSFLIEEQSSDLIRKRVKYSIKIVLKGLNLLNNKDFAYLNNAITNEKFFSSLQYTLDDIEDFSDLLNEIPLKWYGQYLANNKNGMGDSYEKNDYNQLYTEMYNEESKVLEELKTFSSDLITRNGMNLRCAEKILEHMKYSLYQIELAKKIVKIEKFVNTEKIEVCVQTNKKIDNIKNNTNKKLQNNNIIQNPENEINSLIIEASECPHNNKTYLQKIEDSFGGGEKNINHCLYIKDMIKQFICGPWSEELKNDTLLGNNINESDEIKTKNRNTLIYKGILSYMNIVKKKLRNPIDNYGLFNNTSEEELNEILKKIEDHILKRIYKFVYPRKPLEIDRVFYNKTISLEWVKPEQLKIKKEYVNQLGFAELCIKKMDEAISVSDKLECISNALDTVNCTIEFSKGANNKISKNELSTIFQYILIKAQPKRIFSNITYIKCFLDTDELKGKKEELFSLIENAAFSILRVNGEQLGVSNEEFAKNLEEAKKKNNI